jgi:hypothetical protein
VGGEHLTEPHVACDRVSDDSDVLLQSSRPWLVLVTDWVSLSDISQVVAEDALSCLSSR